MRELDYEVSLSPYDVMIVKCRIARGKVLGFTVQYCALLQGEWCPIVRYDTAHGLVHRDLMHPSGTTTKHSLAARDLNQAYTLAQLDIKTNWPAYRAAYERGMAKR